MNHPASNSKSLSVARLPVTLSSPLVAACCLLVLLAAPVRAIDRHVPSVSYPTIGSAVAAVQQGDRILVGPGIYQENVTSIVANVQFIGRSSVWDGTLPNGTAGVCLTATGDVTVVQGFIFRAGQAAVAQVQLTGAGCRVSKCSSRGPSTRFLKITGNSAVVDSCSLFAVDSTAIEIIGDGAMVRKVKAIQGDDAVIRVQGNGATVTGCTMTLCEDGGSITVVGTNTVISLNMFLHCDFGISVTGTNTQVFKNRGLYFGSTFVSINGSHAVVSQNAMSHSFGGGVTISGSDALVSQNTISGALGGSVVVSGGSNAVVRLNKSTDGGSGGYSINSDNGIVLQNQLRTAGTCTVTGDNLIVRKNTIAIAPNDRNGLRVVSRTAAGGGAVEDNNLRDISQIGLSLACNNMVIQRNRVTDAGTEAGESGCVLSGNFNVLTNNVIMVSGTHGFDVSGATNTLVKCTAINAAADGFHVAGNGNTLLQCVAMLCTGEGLDNGGTGTLVTDSLFRKNRIDVANDGTFTNAGTFVTDNVFATGGPNQLPQVD